MKQELKMNQTRIGVLIGNGGETRRALEEKTHSVITIDSEEGTVTIEGDDPVLALRGVEVINAINRGFSPERAFSLLEDEDLLLDVIDLSSSGDSPRHMERVRGRIIGREGSAREQIENLTATQISVFGKTVAIIGLPEPIRTARTAIEMISRGVPHEAVFAFLDKKKKEAKQDMVIYYY